MDDTINRQDAIEAVMAEGHKVYTSEYANAERVIYEADAVEALSMLPSADAVSREVYDKRTQADERIIDSYRREFSEVASAEAVQGDGKMKPIELKKRYPHSRDEDITDAFMRGYKAHAEAVQGWIPCSERLPKAENMYQPPEQRYLCQLEAYGERKFCVLSRLKGAISPFWDWYGVAVHDSEVTAWMPLPTPYKGGDDTTGESL